MEAIHSMTLKLGARSDHVEALQAAGGCQQTGTTMHAKDVSSHSIRKSKTSTPLMMSRYEQGVGAHPVPDNVTEGKTLLKPSTAENARGKAL